MILPPDRDAKDIQGLVGSGYGDLREAVFLLLRVTDAAAARAWLGEVTNGASDGPKVTSVADLRPPHKDRALHVAFTAPGLRNLGVADDIVAAFPREFCEGMAGALADAEGRPRRLGDVGDNAPSLWQWGSEQQPDAVLLLYGTPDTLPVLADAVRAGIAAGFDETHTLPTTYKIIEGGDRLEHFGFRDGISQPKLDWEGKGPAAGPDDTTYTNQVPLGEFLVGHTNGYAAYEDRPLLPPARDPHNCLTAAEDEPDRHDLGRNGTYLVFRHLEQHVAAFWREMAARHPHDDGVALAEAMVGRSLATGDPLLAPESGLPPGAADFTFDADPEGLACPLGAHIRRANPRRPDLPGGPQGLISRLLRKLAFIRGGPRDDLLSTARLHRLLRRGRAYGPFIDRATALAVEAATEPAGLYFICLNASISRQFEFVQNAWLMNPAFDGLSGEADPLLGHRQDFPAGHRTDTFSQPQSTGLCRRTEGLPRFVTVRGGAYFFLPSLRALRYFAQT